MLTVTEAKRFYKDGFLHQKGIVPDDLVRAARRELFERMGALRNEAVRVAKTGDLEALAAANRSMGRSMGSEAIMDLFNRSPLIRLVEHAFGTPVQSVRGAQLATLYPAEDDDKTNEAGYLNRDTPSYG